MADNITNAIMEAYIADLSDYLNEGLLSDDPRYVRSIEKGPLQDDPTLRAGFLIVEPDPTIDPDGYRQPVGSDRKNKLKMVESAPSWEVGGGFLMVNYFKISGWTPKASSKGDVYDQIGSYTRRLERALQRMARNELMAGITTDDGDETTGGLIQVFNLNGTIFSIVGGENEWYGKVSVHFGVYSQVSNRYWA